MAQENVLVINTQYILVCSFCPDLEKGSWDGV